MCVCACVCVIFTVHRGLHHFLPPTYVRMNVGVRVCVCVFVCMFSTFICNAVGQQFEVCVTILIILA